MRMKTRIVVITLIIALVLCGCSKSEDGESSADFDPRVEMARPRLVNQDETAHQESRIAETGPKVHRGVLVEFARRGGGDCIVARAESSDDGIFHFEWESPNDASRTAGEVIGAIMSVLRGYDGYVGGLEIVRTYAGGSRRISISHADYSEFVEGRINDPAFIEKHQLREEVGPSS